MEKNLFMWSVGVKMNRWHIINQSINIFKTTSLKPFLKWLFWCFLKVLLSLSQMSLYCLMSLPPVLKVIPTAHHMVDQQLAPFEYLPHLIFFTLTCYNHRETWMPYHYFILLSDMEGMLIVQLRLPLLLCYGFISFH